VVVLLEGDRVLGRVAAHDPRRNREPVVEHEPQRSADRRRPRGGQPRAADREIAQACGTALGAFHPDHLVEDDPSQARIYSAYLAGQPYELIHRDTGKEAITALTELAPQVVLLDLHLPDMEGFDILRTITERQIPTEVVIITSNASMSSAVQAMQLGARDFVVKPCTKDRLLTTVRNCLDRRRLSEVVATYREEIDRHGYAGFIGSSLVMQGVYRIIDSAARSKAAVFITGESGTGKEVRAEAIHRKSQRAARRFVPINCSAIPKDLMESELFGHVKGAFTGAVRDRQGAVGQAEGGTLFLDEICEMDIALQPKLLRFLQTDSFQRVGDNHIEKADVRIVCATNRNPLEMVAKRLFREDLYYRLYVLPIHLPPLREREGDVVEIAQHFLEAFAREEGKRFRRFAPEAERIVADYPWPGNVRQLQNVIRNAVVLNDGETVTAAMLPALVSPETRIPAAQPTSSEGPAGPGRLPTAGSGVDPTTVIRPLAVLEREAIENALRFFDGNVPEAAHYLGISAATIYRKRSTWERDA
jgi:two-component system repressor protein LuxO